MSKEKMKHPDPMIMNVRKILKAKEPRKMPTETVRNEYGHLCWVCPYCGELSYRKDRVIRRQYGSENIVDYGNYNMHFAHAHGERFWKEKQIINLFRGQDV